MTSYRPNYTNHEMGRMSQEAVVAYPGVSCQGVDKVIVTFRVQDYIETGDRQYTNYKTCRLGQASRSGPFILDGP
jgi:hypothetical protein